MTFSDATDTTTLALLAQNYLDLNDVPLANYSVNFIELSKTTEYQNYAILETVSMGDTVTVRHTRLNIDIQLEVIRIKKNELTNRIEEVELGRFKPNIATSLIRQQQQVDTAAAIAADIQNGDLTAEIIKIGAKNDKGTSQIDTRGDGTRFQSHAPGNYAEIADDGTVALYTTAGGTEHCFGTLNNDGTSTFCEGGMPAVAISIAHQSGDTGVDITRDSVLERWAWVKDETGRVISMTSNRGRTITVTY